MFTGIVDHYGRIDRATVTPGGLALEIGCRFEDLQLGESVSVDGCCLTVTSSQKGSFRCELSPETLEKTVAGRYAVGNAVNLERALRLSDRLGGHFVTGHIDGRIQCLEREDYKEFSRFSFGAVPDAFLGFVIEKGSVALNGVSLTVNKVEGSGFEVMLIPHTLERTSLGSLKKDSLLNIEYDWLSKVVARQMTVFKGPNP